MILKSLYSIKLYKEFQKLLYKKVKILSYIISFLLVVLGIILIFFNYFGYIYVVFGVTLPVFMHVFIKLMENENIKRDVLLQYGASQTFYFEEDRVRLNQVSKLGTFEDEYFYDELVSVYKTKKYYFIFVTRTRAFIVEKEEFVVGNEKELDELLKLNLKDKFINKAPIK